MRARARARARTRTREREREREREGGREGENDSFLGLVFGANDHPEIGFCLADDRKSIIESAESGDPRENKVSGCAVKASRVSEKAIDIRKLWLSCVLCF